MEWWHWGFAIYAAVGLAIALPVIAATARTGLQSGRRPAGALVVAVLVIAALWPVIVLPLWLLIRKAKSLQRQVQDQVQRATAARRPGTGRIIDVEKVDAEQQKMR